MPVNRKRTPWTLVRRLAPLAAALLLAAPARAQSLQALYETARGYDATYLAAQAQAQSADYRVEQARALNRLSVGANGSATHTQAQLPDPLGRTSSNDLTGQIRATLPLINGANTASIAQAEKALEASRADLEAAEQDLIVRLAQAYFDVLAAQDTLATTRSSKAFITEQLASAQRNFEVGTATITDTREAQARFDLATAQEIAADNDLLAKRIALDQLVGRTGVMPRPLAVPVVLPPVMPAQVDTWVTQADGLHPSVRRARLALDVAQLEIERARAADRFTLDAVGTVGTTRDTGSGASFPGTTTSAQIGLQLNIPLYTGGANSNRIKETLALEDKSRNDLEAARRSIAQGTRVAFFGVQSGLAQVKALEAAESSSKLALEATQLGYKVGVRVNVDVLNAQAQLFQTQRDLARARYDVVVGSLRLRQAAGQLTPADVQAANALLAP